MREFGVAFNFQVLVAGKELALSHVRGLALEADPATLTREADRGTAEGFRFAAKARPTTVVLRRTVDGSRELFAWRKEALDGKPALRDVDILQLDRLGEKPVAHWRLRGCWPLRWSGPELDAIAGGVAYEELELVCAGVDWI